MTNGDSFDALLAYVEDELSFATSHYNTNYLDRRVSSRMRRTGCESYEEYFDHLRDDATEQAALLDSMCINVTGFFRNPGVWTGIRDVLRSVSAETDVVRVWSAACADGREPYSLSMLAHDDPEIRASSVRILATDISEAALETARDGVYRESQTVDIADQLGFLEDYSKYVDCDGQSFHVKRAVRQNVTFERHDLINDEPQSGFDLVVCRNLFIYINSEFKESMLGTISQSLQPTGYLVIGKTETIPPGIKSEFSVYDSQFRIYQRNVTNSVTQTQAERTETQPGRRHPVETDATQSWWT